MDIGVTERDGELLRLLDERDIVAVAVRYCWALDARDWDALEEVFAPAATADLLTGGSILEGRDAIIARISGALESFDETQHIVSTHEVRVDGGTATHRCYLHAQHVRHGADGGSNYVIAGRYEDDLVRTADGWRITHRRLTPMWTDGNRAVVAR
jgi:hypothetical protein